MRKKTVRRHPSRPLAVGWQSAQTRMRGGRGQTPVCRRPAFLPSFLPRPPSPPVPYQKEEEADLAEEGKMELGARSEEQQQGRSVGRAATAFRPSCVSTASRLKESSKLRG